MIILEADGSIDAHLVEHRNQKNKGKKWMDCHSPKRDWRNGSTTMEGMESKFPRRTWESKPRNNHASSTPGASK
jgi:hypothetical protein